MIRFTTNAGKIANRLREKLLFMDRAIPDGLQRAAIKINAEALKNLSGNHADAPGSFPVPNRTGNLFRSQNWEMSPDRRSAFVFNAAPYAIEIHEGRDTSAKYGRRPFLDDASNKIDMLAEMQMAIQRSLQA